MHHAFLEAIYAQPEDDVPRLIYADFLEEHGNSQRAEFIRLQCQVAQMEPTDPQTLELWRQANELLDANGKEWTAKLRKAVRYLRPEDVHFWRGFPRLIDLYCDRRQIIGRIPPITEIRTDIPDSPRARWRHFLMLLLIILKNPIRFIFKLTMFGIYTINSKIGPLAVRRYLWLRQLRRP